MPCTVRCQRSTKPVSTCRCSCGGSNHGSAANPEGRNGSPKTAAGSGVGAGVGAGVRAADPAPNGTGGATRSAARENPTDSGTDSGTDTGTQSPAPATLDPEEAAAATPGPVRRLAAVFEANGKSFHLVGGYVRDLMRGEDPKDVDATTNARPREIKRLLLAGGASSLFDVGERFGTVGAAFEGGLDVEVTTYRSEEYDPGSRKPRVTFGDSLEDDLARRDFTFNAMALEPQSGTLVDPHGGAEDLDRGVVRAVGEPDDRLGEDPLRMMRAVRFSAKLGFSLDGGLKASMSRNAAGLDSVSRERVREELEKTLAAPSPPSRAVETMRETGMLGRVLPEVADTVGVRQEGPHHDADVYGHTLRVADAVPRNAPLSVKLAALYHDTGKPETKALSEGADGTPKATFYGHEEVSAQKARTALLRLRYDGDTVEATAHLCREHMRPLSLQSAKDGYSEGAVRRFVARVHLARGDKTLASASDVMALNRADILGHNPSDHGRMLSRWEDLSGRVRRLGDAPPESRPESAKSPLDGGEIMRAFGGRPGKWIGEVKSHLTDLVVEGVLQPGDKAGARQRATAFLAASSGR